MTHNELLAKVEDKIAKWELLSRQARTAGWAPVEDSYGVFCSAKALRAVIERHHPLYYRKGTIETAGAHCSECSKGSHGDSAIEYPCPTIQDVQKELQ